MSRVFCKRGLMKLSVVLQALAFSAMMSSPLSNQASLSSRSLLNFNKMARIIAQNSEIYLLKRTVKEQRAEINELQSEIAAFKQADCVICMMNCVISSR